MVSIRRPRARKGGGGGVGGGAFSSLLTFRNAVMVVIAFQSVNLASQVFQRSSSNPTSTTTTSSSSLSQKALDEVYAKQKDGLRKRKQDLADEVRIEKGGGGGDSHPNNNNNNDNIHADHLVTDTDDHVAKPDPVVKAAAAKAAAGVAAVKKEEPKKEVVVPPVKGPAAVEKKPAEVKQVKKQVGVGAKTAEVLAKHGSGATQLGYVVDLVREREHPPFRDGPLLAASDEEEEAVRRRVAVAVSEKGVQPCESVEGRTLKQRPACRDADTPLVAYNGAEFPRSLCGHVIAPLWALKLVGDELHNCNEPAQLFPQDTPPVSGKGMPPIVVQSQPQEQATPTTAGVDRVKIECDIPCEYEKDLAAGGGKNGAQYVAGTDWSITRTDANPYASNEAKVERTAFRRDQYYSTMYLSSSVPLSWYSFEKYGLRNRPPVKWEDAANKATYLLDEQCTVAGGIRRHKWYDAVKAAFPTAAYGSCDRNAELAEGETLATPEGRVAVARKNRIHLAYEAGNEKDYASPIVWESLLSGSVPAILGARNADAFLPPHSAILTSSYNDWDKFAADVKSVSENKTRWESYHAWRTDEKALSAFEERFNFTRTSPECRTCRWAYAKMYGLGWDHEQQVVRDPVLQRKLCTDPSSKLVTTPFREVWVHGSSKKRGEGSAADSCATGPVEAAIELDGSKVDRAVMPHDGVVDMTIKSVAQGLNAGDLVLRLEFNVKNSEGAYFPNTHTLVPTTRGPLASSASIQDEKAKVTVLANWETTITSPDEGAIEIVVSRKGEGIGSDESRRIRVITEDMSVLHDKLTEFFPSSYGRLMTKDFVDPLELFVVDS